MPRICIKAPEIVMSGDITINTGMAVTSKAKLESVTVGGDCACGDTPPPPPREPTPPPVVTEHTNIEIVFLVDGSDSFDRTKVVDKLGEQGGIKTMETQFNSSMRWCGRMIEDKIVPGSEDSVVASVVQFSGIKQLENSYQENNNGWAIDSSHNLKHYNVELEPQQVRGQSGLPEKLAGANALDGNSQLFLALRDMSNDQFVQKLDNATNAPNIQNVVWKKKRVLVVITDDEWDVGMERASLSESGLNLSTASTSSSGVQRDAVIEQVKQVYGGADNDMFAIIVTPSEIKTESTTRVVNDLCNGNQSNLIELTENDFTDGMEKALNSIAQKILNGTARRTL